MRKLVFYIILFVFFSLVSYAQENIFIPKHAQVFFHSDTKAGIFGNLSNYGKIGITKSAIINFIGNRWENSSKAQIIAFDNSNSKKPVGVFKFTGNKKQVLIGGFDFDARQGTSFTNISIDNPAGIKLKSTDVYVKGDLHFENGNLYLNSNKLFVKNKITGYSEKRFIVTNNSLNKGGLYYNPTYKTKHRIFPLGTNKNSYSPMQIEASKSFKQTIGASIQEHVYSQIPNGELLDSFFVKKTWILYHTTEIPHIKLKLQHHIADEGVLFSAYRDSSYISLYLNQKHHWDIDSNEHTIQKFGNLTTTQPNINTYLNTRSFSSSLPNGDANNLNLVSISTAQSSNAGCPVAKLYKWEVKRTDENTTTLSWQTHFEDHIHHFEVQRKRDTGLSYSTIFTVPSKATNSPSRKNLFYRVTDQEFHKGWTKYRLKLESRNGCITYTKERFISSGIQIKIWPNPSTNGKIYVQIKGTDSPIALKIINIRGQRIGKYRLNSKQTNRIKNLPSADLFLIFSNPNENFRRIKTVKLIVQ
ncbi:MAG TPA: hypothetical protein VK084_05895 [Chitinophagaceae bacterium]|nr:hypothetical protein [Chitinophagaceae bacterium]